jgi:hypothetical protein
MPCLPNCKRVLAKADRENLWTAICCSTFHLLFLLVLVIALLVFVEVGLPRYACAHCHIFWILRLLPCLGLLIAMVDDRSQLLDLGVEFLEPLHFGPDRVQDGPGRMLDFFDINTHLHGSYLQVNAGWMADAILQAAK